MRVKKINFFSVSFVLAASVVLTLTQCSGNANAGEQVVTTGADSVYEQLEEQVGKSKVIYLYTNKVVRKSDLSIGIRKFWGGASWRIISDNTVDGIRTIHINFLYKNELKFLKVIVSPYIPVADRTH